MFVPQTGDMLVRFHDLLRMHGRVGIATWSAPGESELYRTVLMPAGREMLEHDRERSEIPYSLNDGPALLDMLHGAGFAHTRLEKRAVRAEFDQPETLWDAFVGTDTWRGQRLAESNPDGYARARARSLRQLRDLGPWPRELESVAILARGERIV
jgi:hypothetical protein